jgi:hypothetical protein
MEDIAKDRLYQLLPYIYRLRDSERGSPLRELLQVIAEQVGIIEANMDQIYDNWFIETCEDWAVPYLGDLIGYTQVHDAGLAGDMAMAEGSAKNSVLFPRREVANTIAYRRRKGSLALLEQLSNDITGWPARAVEFFSLLGWTQHLAHLNLARGRYVDLRQSRRLGKLNGPFCQSAHTVDIRNIESPTAYKLKAPQGRYNIANVGLFVWRLRSYSVARTPAAPLEQSNCFTFSALGNNTQLFTAWTPECDAAKIAGRANVPAPISHHDFAIVTDEKIRQASSRYYGENKSLIIWAPGWPSENSPQPIPIEQIVPADLSIWNHYRPVKNTVAVDPVLGRIVFPPNQKPRNGIEVHYHYGFSADIGGGEYFRPLQQPLDADFYEVGFEKTDTTINQALKRWHNTIEQRRKDNEPQKLEVIIEISDGGLYQDAVNINIPENYHLQIRAANYQRPVIFLADHPDQFTASGAPGSFLSIEGLLVAGRGLQIEGNISGVAIRHSTLVPGWTLKPDCEPDRLEEPSIEISNSFPCLTIEHSIVGSIQINNNEVNYDPLPVRISDSILDATGTDCEGPRCEAIGAYGTGIAHVNLTIVRSTVFGCLDIHAIELAENAIFMGLIKVARRQVGCLRFSYVKPGSRTPMRYLCQPDTAQEISEQDLRDQAEKTSTVPDESEIQAVRISTAEYVRPQFTSHRYGTPAYCQLEKNCATEIKEGADDESEMGVFHNLFQPQKMAGLLTRLDEYTPARCDIGVILVN